MTEAFAESSGRSGEAGAADIAIPYSMPGSVFLDGCSTIPT